MHRQLALFVCVLLILWLFARDRKWRPMTSWALCVPLLWIVIIGSRPVSFWFREGLQMMTPEDYLEGSPFDRNVYMFLIVVGLAVLLRRRVNWGRIFTSNRWYFAFILYCGISIIWSDYPFVSFKRWIKDVGNVVMVMVILTEKDPFQATKAVFSRYTYVAMPISVLFIKYFPELGRYYNRWTYLPVFSGITTEKNALGCFTLFCGLYLVWDLIEMRSAGARKTDKADLLSRLVLLLMVFGLISKADSSTALVCLILGSGILIFMRPPLSKRRAGYIGMCTLAVAFLIILMYSASVIFESVVEMVGRDVTMTGRTDIWANLLKEPVNLLLGTGYQSFWTPDIRERYHLNQAHNGYLETYLNGGLIGVSLLMAMIISTGRKLKKELLLGSSYGVLRFSFLIAIVLMNWTEAAFGGLSFAWITLLIAALNYPRSPSSMENIAERVNSRLLGKLAKR